MKFNIYAAIVAVLVLGGVLGAVSLGMQTVDPKTLPPEIQPFWFGIVFIFTTSAATPIFAGITNIYGYWKNKYGAPANVRSSVEYEANQFYGTYLRLEGYIKGVNLFVVALTMNTPLAVYAAYISGSAAFILDVVRRTLEGLKPTSGTATP